MTSRRLSFGATLVFGVAVMTGVIAATRSGPRSLASLQQPQTPTPTAERTINPLMLTPQATSTPVLPGTPDPSAAPLFTAAEAIEACQRFIPAGVTVDATVARLVSRGTAATWLRDDPANWLADAPIWITGLSVTAGITKSATIRLPGGERLSDESDVVHGMFCVRNANSGQLYSTGALLLGSGEGVLTPQSDPFDMGYSYDAIVALANEALTIEHATAIPYPTDLPNP